MSHLIHRDKTPMRNHYTRMINSKKDITPSAITQTLVIVLATISLAALIIYS